MSRKCPDGQRQIRKSKAMTRQIAPRSKRTAERRFDLSKKAEAGTVTFGVSQQTGVLSGKRPMNVLRCASSPVSRTSKITSPILLPGLKRFDIIQKTG